MIRRAALAVFLVAFALGILSTEAGAAKARRRITTITELSVSRVGNEIIVTGDLLSARASCTRGRRVGLFLGGATGAQLDVTRSLSDGTFSLNAVPSSGTRTYSVIAYQQNCGCMNYSPMAEVTFTFTR